MRRLIPFIFLMGCTHQQPPEIKIVTQTVNIPVPVSCVPNNTPEAPKYAVTKETLLAASDMAERYRQLQIGWLEREARLKQVEPIIEVCKKINQEK